METLTVGKSALRNQADRNLVLEDIFRRQVIIGCNQTVIDDKRTFLPFFLIEIDTGTGESLLTDGGDSCGNHHFLEVLAILESLVVDA